MFANFVLRFHIYWNVNILVSGPSAHFIYVPRAETFIVQVPL